MYTGPKGSRVLYHGSSPLAGTDGASVQARAGKVPARGIIVNGAETARATEKPSPESCACRDVYMRIANRSKSGIQRAEGAHKLIVSHSHSRGPLIEPGCMPAGRPSGIFCSGWLVGGIPPPWGPIAACMGVALGWEDSWLDAKGGACVFRPSDFPFSTPASTISVSPETELPARLVLRARRGATVRVGAVTGGCVTGFGGPGAMATTFGFSGWPVLVGVVADPPAEPAADRGDSTSVPEAFVEPVPLDEA